ncbi:MAG: AAA family ATPase [Muribaculaceae bacterium]|nr:AAA family ATPase [Muribaculaceae bacterium]
MLHKTGFPLADEGVRAFLAGAYVEGVGPVYARRLVERFGTDAIRVLRDGPVEAEGIPGLGAVRIEQASKSLHELPASADLLAFLYGCGLGEGYIERILGKYRRRTAEVIASDPYEMVENVWQLSFHTADKIGRALGIEADDPRRLRGALLTAVKHYADEGHLFATFEEALREAARISGVDVDILRPQIQTLVAEGRLVESRGGLYLPVYYKAEKEGAVKLLELASQRVRPVAQEGIAERDAFGHEYSKAQRRAIEMILSSPVAVLTGGPGSGKTTILRAVIEAFHMAGMKTVLVAPTGRAAKRMTVLTGTEASTIHRLLGYRPGEGYHVRHIDADVLIVDESSMLEQVLFNHLLQALRPDARLILVGDVDQLPAIGAGDVLRDLIESHAVPVARLRENFRQAEGSLIAAAARSINEGRMPKAHAGADFEIVYEPSASKIRERVLSLVAEEIPRERHIRPTDIRVVTPQQVGPLGARRLNDELRERINPSGPELRRGNTIFRLGDPVLQKSNSRERGVYNGETGRIVSVDEDALTLEVEFDDGRRSVYQRSELGELAPAYATTVHKLQGSEVGYMVFPLTLAHKPMLYRNLLYTGVSRAGRLCVLVAEPGALEQAISTLPAVKRNSNFKHRLRKKVP